MPEFGEIRVGKELGYKCGGRHAWRACEVCGKGRWIPINQLNNRKMCIDCSNKSRAGRYGEDASRWKGGRRRTDGGYIQIKLHPGDFFYSMVAKNGYVLEHRLVMAKYLGRCLHRWEIVHHKEGVAKDDNRREGLQLVTDDRHKQITILENRIGYLEKRVILLEAELEVERAAQLTDWLNKLEG